MLIYCLLVNMTGQVLIQFKTLSDESFFVSLTIIMASKTL